MDKKKKPFDVSTILFGKVPPQARDLEEDILGTMLYDYTAVAGVKQILNENDFYVDANKYICKAIFDIADNGIPDISLVAQWLMKAGLIEDIGGLYTLTKLMNRVTATSTLNIQQYCGIVKQKSILRRLIDFGGAILQKSYEDTEDVFDVLHEAENGLKGINNELEEIKVTPISNIAMNVLTDFDNKVYNAQNNIPDANAVYTGFKEWDEINGTLFPGLYIVAGRPGMGKGVHMTELICRMGKIYDVGIINGEMTDEQLLKRIGCNLMGIDNYLFKKNPIYVTKEEQENLHAAMNEALNLKIHIYSNRRINKIANKIKLWVEQYGVKCILADFLTLFKVPPELEKYYNNTQKVDYVLDIFTALCKDLKIPIILYVQMNREILGRHGAKEPNLADLKQSGSIEELAYQVVFLHRPEYYDEKAITDEFGENIKDLMYQIIAKHREGKLGRFKSKAELSRSRLSAWGQENTGYPQGVLQDLPF